MAQIVEFTDIPLNLLEIGKSQVRLSEVGKGIEELADSISKVGLLEPIVVAPQRANGKHEIILGQRRFLAHLELGLETIKAGILDEHVEETVNQIRQELSQIKQNVVVNYSEGRSQEHTPVFSPNAFQSPQNGENEEGPKNIPNKKDGIPKIYNFLNENR